MKLKTVLHLILILDILILAGAAAGQAAAPISNYRPEEIISESAADLKIDEIFIKNEYIQIKYIFKIIEISKKAQTKMNLDELFYDKSSKGKIDFYSNDEIVEFLDPVSLNNIKIEYKDKNNFSYSIIEPEIIVSLFENASIEVNEEVMNITDEEEFIRLENKLNLTLFTRNISRDQKIITTDLRVETKDNTFLNTTIKTINGEENLVGILVINNSDLARNQKKLYAVYIKAISLRKLSKDNNKIINLDGLNNIVSSTIFDNKRDEEKYILLFIGENNSIKSKIVFKREFALYLDYEEDDYIMLGVDKTMFSKLNLELNAYTWNQIEYYLSLGVNEEVRVSPYFSLGAGVYPIVYEVESEKFQEEYYWVNAKIFIFNEKNQISLFYQQKNEKEDLRLELSRKFWNNLDIILANEINKDRKEEWELGLKWNF